MLLNKSVQSGIYPSKLKHAKIVPAFKNEDQSDPNNYMPISLLSVFNRIFVKLIYKQLKSLIVSVTKFSIVIGSPRAYLSCNLNFFKSVIGKFQIVCYVSCVYYLSLKSEDQTTN